MYRGLLVARIVPHVRRVALLPMCTRLSQPPVSTIVLSSEPKLLSADVATPPSHAPVARAPCLSYAPSAVDDLEVTYALEQYVAEPCPLPCPLYRVGEVASESEEVCASVVPYDRQSCVLDRNCPIGDA